MQKTAIISVDGHVKPARSAYREYLDPKFRERCEERLVTVEGTPDGFVHPGIGEDAQWDARRRVADLETQGVVAEVLFSNGKPFEDPAIDRSTDSELTRASNMAYNRWLVDFCSEAPGRLCGLAAVAFDNIEQAVRDIHWAKENGLGGILMPPLHPGGRYFFDPALDPIWEACQELRLPLSQHGGTGAPNYEPQSFASFMVRAAEHSFFSGRSLWQLILGGVFERFPDLKIAYVETEAWWIGPMIEMLDRRETVGDDWTEFAETLRRIKPYSRLPSEYWASNCFAGLSPFTVSQLSLEDLGSGGDVAHEGFGIRSANAMLGVDYPHPETVFPGLLREVKALVEHPRVTESDVRKVLYENAAEVFGFDLAGLRPVIDRVGFDIADVPAPPPDPDQAMSLVDILPTLAAGGEVSMQDQS